MLVSNEDCIEALGIFGSAAQAAEQDAWSNIDAVVVVADDALARFHPSVDWLTPLGDRLWYINYRFVFLPVLR